MSAFDKVIGYEDIKQELLMVCDVMKNAGKYSSLGVTTPKGVLLHGVPGVGKTLMASCVIEESGRPAFTVRKDRSDGDFVNTIKETFEKAKEAAPSIVFLDDIDKFANEDRYHRDAEEYVTVQSCIDSCADCEVFALATANDTDYLPDSLLRAGRFDKVIHMDAPVDEDAVKIIGHFLKSKAVVGDVDAYEIARLLDGRSCAALESAINEAGIYAAYAGREKICQNDIIDACLRVMFDAPKSVFPKKENELRTVAIHEAGHALVAEILDPGSVNLVSVCGYCGDTGGVTSVKKPDGYYYSKELMEHRVIGILGGKAATELVDGVADTGANSDIHRAFNIVARFVDNYCAYGFEAFERNEASEFLREKKDRMVTSEVDGYYRRAKRIIAENRALFDKIVCELIKRKTLTCRDIARIKGDIAA